MQVRILEFIDGFVLRIVRKTIDEIVGTLTWSTVRIESQSGSQFHGTRVDANY